MIYHDGSEDFNGLERHVKEVVQNLKGELDKFDCIITQGISGQCVAFPVALALKKPLLVLRKKGENRHGTPGTLVNRQALRTHGGRCLFLDDFVSSGATRRRCETAIGINGRIVGTCQYAASPSPRSFKLEWVGERTYYRDAQGQFARRPRF